jgi:glutathione synthase/RimK-type ligase-like ATP-grasp enzyme
MMKKKTGTLNSQPTIKKAKSTSNLTPKKAYTRRYVQIFSRHPSHNELRRVILSPVRACMRFGSHTEKPDKYEVEINLASNIDNSANKLFMKRMFTKAGVKTAAWVDPSTITAASGKTVATEVAKLEFPIIAKHIFGSKNRGNTKIDTAEQLTTWMKGKTLSNYIFEKFHNFNREYRLHVTPEGYFYACRKMLKNETPDDKRWYRNDDNSIWVTEFTVQRDAKEVIVGETTTDNPGFDRPVNWKEIADECVKALNAVGLDFGACDVRVQASKDGKGKVRPTADFIIIEINSAPGLGTLGVIKYKEMIPKLINYKLNKKN